ncbi:hypothetical protein [Polaribacter sp.]|uniref:hypothetical protein n=1 Tax=Polaribacter sp. TaxID=1920175 RepID=UPI003F6A63AF
MENSNNVGITIVKLTAITTVIIWSCIIYDGFDIGMTPYIFLSIIIIFILWSLIILCTIMPFFWFGGIKSDKKLIFKRYFPFYTIAVFLFFLSIIIASDFETIAFMFFIPVFFGLMQSWVWLCKPDNINKKISSQLID